MTNKGIIVVETDLQQELPVARSIIKTLSLHKLMESGAPGPYGLSQLHLSLLDIIEHAGAQMMELTKRLRNRISDDRGHAGFGFASATTPTDDAFCNLFSVYAAAEAAAARSQVHTQDKPEIRGGFTQQWVTQIPVMESRQVVQVMVGELSAFYDHYRNHPDPARRITAPEDYATCTYAFFALLANGVRTIVEDAEYEHHRRALEQVSLDICGRHYRGFSASTTPAQDEEPGELLPVWPGDIVGNRQYLEAGLRLARDVAGFDMETGRNPKRLNPVLFGQGSPGCGKTITAHAIGNFFLDYCRKRNVPAHFLVIRRTDWASSYQNASANQLVNIFRSKVQAFPGVVGVYWPDIDTAFAARSSPGLRSEESNILGASFGIFDGTLIPKNGKWFLICDANYMNMDEATLSRITQDPHKIRGPVTPEDYVELVRDKKLKDFRDLLQLSDDEWAEVGQMCIDFGLSGRNVDNICQKVITEVQDVEPPDEYYSASFEERKNILRQLSKPMTLPRLKAILEGYKTFEKEAEATADRERFEQRVQEIVLNLSAQRAAMEAIEGKG